MVGMANQVTRVQLVKMVKMEKKVNVQNTADWTEEYFSTTTDWNHNSLLIFTKASQKIYFQICLVFSLLEKLPIFYLYIVTLLAQRYFR
jgi:hypothetical protein